MHRRVTLPLMIHHTTCHYLLSFCTSVKWYRLVTTGTMLWIIRQK